MICYGLRPKLNEIPCTKMSPFPPPADKEISYPIDYICNTGVTPTGKGICYSIYLGTTSVIQVLLFYFVNMYNICAARDM